MFGEIASSPAIYQPANLPLTALPQQDSVGNIVGWYDLNADGTVTVWDNQGLNPMTTVASPPTPGNPYASIFNLAPPPNLSHGVATVTGAVTSAVGQTLGQTLAGTVSGLASGLGLTPVTLVLAAGVVLFLFAGPGLLAGPRRR
jgi:hypothetical protein